MNLSIPLATYSLDQAADVNILGGVELLRNFEKTKLFIRNGYIGSRGLSSDAKWQTYTIARKLIFLN